MKSPSAISAVLRVRSKIDGRLESETSPELTIAQRIRQNGFTTLLVSDNRMFPWIRRGDSLFIRRIGFVGVNAGDCILFERGSRAVVRRVLRIARVGAEENAESALVVKSYAHGHREDFVTPRQFLGRAIRIHRRAKHIDMQSFERNLLGRLLAGISILKYSVQRFFRALKAILTT